MTGDVADEPVIVLLLDVGQGDSTLVLLPGKRAIVFDCRDDQVVDRHLRDFEVEQLEAVVISHLDWDHIAGAKQLLEQWRSRVSAIYIDTDERALDDKIDENQHAKSLIDYVTLPREGEDRVPWKVRTPESDVVVAQAAHYQVRILAPSQRMRLRDERAGRSPNANERSAVLQIRHFGPDDSEHRVLIGADAPLVTWAEVPTEGLGASVFRTPHHGGSLDDGGIPEGWSVDRLYDEVNPSEAVISVGTDNRHEHPDPRWCHPVAKRQGCAVRCTQLTERCHPGAKDDAVNLRREALDQRGRAEPAWRHLTSTGRASNSKSRKEIPCGGTVSVRLAGGKIRVDPTLERHATVVGLWSHPWCIHGFEASEPDHGSDDIGSFLAKLLRD